MIKVIAIIFCGAILLAFLFTVFARYNNEKKMDKFIILVSLIVLTSCTAYKPLIEENCEPDPTVIPPGKTWKQVQDSCKTRMDFL